MEINQNLLERLIANGVGRLKMDDPRFKDDEPPPRLGVYDLDDESLCHDVIQTSCNIPGCNFTSESLLDFENHYNASHRYSCEQCKKILPSPHLLDLHLQERHDSFFAVMAERKPSYCCYIEECRQKFQNSEQRWDHCVREHKLPKKFKFDDTNTKKTNKKNKSQKTKKKEIAGNLEKGETNTEDAAEPMQTDSGRKRFTFHNNKQKTFQYKGKKFTKDQSNNSKGINIDVVMAELKENLPE